MLPATRDVTPLVLEMVKFAAGVTVDVVVTLLLLVLLSKAAPNNAAVAVLVRVPVKLLCSGTEITKTAVPPIDRLTVEFKGPVPLAAAQALTTAVPSTPGVAMEHVHVALTDLTPVEGNRSITETLPATAGPGLLTTRV